MRITQIILLLKVILERKLLKEVFEEHNINDVINFTAESHKDRSIENPEILLLTNICGT